MPFNCESDILDVITANHPIQSPRMANDLEGWPFWIPSNKRLSTIMFTNGSVKISQQQKKNTLRKLEIVSNNVPPIWRNGSIRNFSWVLKEVITGEGGNFPTDPPTIISPGLSDCSLKHYQHLTGAGRKHRCVIFVIFPGAVYAFTQEEARSVRRKVGAVAWGAIAVDPEVIATWPTLGGAWEKLKIEVHSKCVISKENFLTLL